MAAPATVVTSYTTFRAGAEIARQVCVGDGVVFDVDAGGHPVGAETIGMGADWRDGLYRLIMAGQVTLGRSIDQGPELDAMIAERDDA